jgi:hypothetical protein
MNVSFGDCGFVPQPDGISWSSAEKVWPSEIASRSLGEGGATESRTSPQSDATGSSTEAIETAEIEVSLEADEGTPCSTDATLEQEAEAESTIDGYNEAEEA